jgi:hypothetical protein
MEVERRRWAGVGLGQQANADAGWLRSVVLRVWLQLLVLTVVPGSACWMEARLFRGWQRPVPALRQQFAELMNQPRSWGLSPSHLFASGCLQLGGSLVCPNRPRRIVEGPGLPRCCVPQCFRSLGRASTHLTIRCGQLSASLPRCLNRGGHV